MNRRVLVFKMILEAILGLGVALGGCSGSEGSPALAPSKPSPPAVVAEPGPATPGVTSEDILAREPISNTATVKHILISWKDLADAFQGHLSERAAQRSKADAEAEVRSLIKQLQDGADFDTLMKANSEDTSSAKSGQAFTVTPNAGLVIEFRQLSLRLHTGEVGVCQSDFGFHIIKRIG
jgi:PPIC-type PPIASE domain